MPLPLPRVPRTLKHTRALDFKGYERTDGLWEIEGHITDVKPYDMPWEVKPLPAGVPQHDMSVRITIDTDFNIREALVSSDEHPYDGYCGAVVPDYGKLVGLNLLKGFRKGLKERLGGIKGCTHISEMLGVLPTAAFQTVAAAMEAGSAHQFDDYAFDGCAAMDRRGEAVRIFYPKWYIGDGNKTPAA